VRANTTNQERRGVAVPGDLLDREHQVQRAGPVAAVFLGQAAGEQAGLCEQLVDVLGVFGTAIDVPRPRLHLLPREPPDDRPQFLVLRDSSKSPSDTT
jgi:hypothetical protein